MRLGVGRTMDFEALPVVGQLPGEENLAAQVSCARVGALGASLFQAPAPLGIETGLEGSSKMREKVAGQGLELLTIVSTVRFGRRAIVPLAELDEQVKRGHLHRLFDALCELRVDALDQAARIVRAVAKPGRPEGVVRHGVASMRLSPWASGSGVIP